MQSATAEQDKIWPRDESIGRIVSVTGSKAVVLLDPPRVSIFDDPREALVEFRRLLSTPHEAEVAP